MFGPSDPLKCLQGSDQAPVSSLECNQDDINQLAINPKGTYLAAADDTGSIQVSSMPHAHGEVASL